MNTNDNNDARYAEQLAKDTADAKRAPEIAAWLRLGPLYFQEIVGFRRDRLIEQGYSTERVEARAAESVLHDLGRVGGQGGPVVFEGSQFHLDESRRAVIDAWVREDAFRQAGITSDDLDGVL
ncbi:hypothetical protein [Microbacterium sp. UCD-TDU]|uniref:hypothetical protein n=1 Tax=Microbacterium sp. UCD-TDU TaxID=1247714 RepID=UPI0003486E81|nr:hypothetical protein [Microbacterium sp. UCD-TDU]EYT58585.1 hypothetical protein D514_0115765 [Microbacterium sp. UCD-TDU]